MGFLDKRRSKLQPSEIRAAEQEAQRQTAMAVSIATRRAEAKVQAEVLEALKQVVEG